MKIPTDHRPWPPPDRPWAMAMRWHDLMFMHWPVPPAALRPLVPARLDLDAYDGHAWLGVVPFRMTGVRPRFVPPIPGVSAFPELNVRTYVTDEDKPGIWFFSLDAHNPIAVRLARATFSLPYFDAEMSCRACHGEVAYTSVRTHRGAPEARFAGRYRPVGEPFNSRPGTLEHFLTERYCLYSAGGTGNVYRGDIHHHRWPLQRAEAGVESPAMTEPLGGTLPKTEPLLHFSRRLDTLAWPPRRMAS